MNPLDKYGPGAIRLDRALFDSLYAAVPPEERIANLDLLDAGIENLLFYGITARKPLICVFWVEK